MASLDDLDGKLDGVNKRIDILTVEITDVKSELHLHGDLLRAMQDTQQVVAKSIVQMNERTLQMNEKIGQLDSGQNRLIGLVAKIVDWLTDFEEGASVELDNVDYDQSAHKLKGTIKRITR
jgi:hypothetical protein